MDKFVTCQLHTHKGSQGRRLTLLKVVPDIKVATIDQLVTCQIHAHKGSQVNTT